MNTYQSKTATKTIATVVSIVVILGVVFLIEALQKPASPTPVATPAPVAPSSSSASSSSGTYKDGTYTADQQYYVPHGYEDIKVTLTVASGVVTDSSIVNSENDRDSKPYQEDFANRYKSSVVGKKLSDLKLAYVSGASDTTGAFNDAVAAIRTQAQA